MRNENIPYEKNAGRKNFRQKNAGRKTVMESICVPRVRIIRNNNNNVSFLGIFWWLIGEDSE